MAASGIAQGILLFAQSIQEMLWHESWDNYKVHALDTFFRLAEANWIFEDITNRDLNQKIVNPICEEIEEYVFSDPIVKSVLNDKSIQHKKLFSSNKSFEYRKRFNYDLLSRISDNFKELMERELIQAFRDGKRTKDIYDLTQSYCSHLINYGYSRKYILECVHKTFWDKNHKRVDARLINKFFRNFRLIPKRYDVVLTIKPDSAKMFQGAFKRFVHDNAQSVPKKITSGKELFFKDKNSSFVTITQEAMDPYSARSAAETDVEVWFAASRLTTHRLSSWIGDHALVIQRRGGKWLIDERNASTLFRRKQTSVYTISENIKTYNSIFSKYMNSPTSERFVRSIRMRNAATQTRSSDLQITAIWAALETLLSEPRENIRIIHYIDQMVPLICKGYSVRTLNNYWADVETIIGKEKSNNYLELVSKNKPKWEKVFIFSVDYKFQKERTKLLYDLHNAPLCRLRAMKINQNFSNAKSLYSFINSHKKRIEWQIHRIYRCRNLIVHSARRLSFIDTLVLNLDEYYLNAIQCINEYMKDKNEYREIDDIVFSVGIDYYSSMNLLESMSKTQHDPLSLIDLL